MDTHQLTLDLLRHGETTAGKVFLGRSDPALTELGRQQMSRALIDVASYQQIISSPLQRCAEFARRYAESHHLPLIIDDGLSELDFGVWDGLSSEQIWQTDADALGRFWSDPVKYPPTNGEDMKDFYQRTVSSLQNIMADQSLQQVLLISHGGSIRNILGWALGLPMQQLNRLVIDHGSLSRVELTLAAGELFPRVQFINQIKR
ncbi:MAG: histidine phosphatase family protein [Gammaproteobacteria bacterium]